MCPDSPMQMCRMLCPPTNCPAGQCAMRHGSCCDMTCESPGATVVAVAGRPSISVGRPGRPTVVTATSTPPADCTSWHDGCNTCRVVDGQIAGCTKMMCARNDAPFCRAFQDGTECGDAACAQAHGASGALAEDDVCYRFCEDSSLPFVARRDDCPAGTTCRTTLPPGMAAFDSCHTPDTCQRDDAAAGGCSDDSECDAGFCRPTTMDYSGPKACVAFSAAGENCGGYTPPNFQTRCAPGLECVNTMGPMIADAPGTCSELCEAGAARDAWGNCITPGCTTWFDGCNTCTGAGTREQACTEEFCGRPTGAAECRDDPSAAAAKGGATAMCPNSPMQMCRMLCPPTNCPAGQCAMRHGSCCDVSCESPGQVRFNSILIQFQFNFNSI